MAGIVDEGAVARAHKEQTVKRILVVQAVIELADSGENRVRAGQRRIERSVRAGRKKSREVRKRSTGGAQARQLRAESRKVARRPCGVTGADKVLRGRSYTRCRDRNGVGKGAAHFVLLGFEVTKEEESVPDDAAAHAAAVLFERQGRIRNAIEVAEEIVGVPRIRAAVSVSRSMEGVAAGFDADVHYRAGLPAVFGARI